MSGLRVGLLGASGAVGREMLRGLATTDLVVDELVLYSSKRSSGSTFKWRGKELSCIELGESSIRPLDLVLASAGAGVSREWAPRFAALGATVVDNSSAFRTDPASPLVVPEVNPHALDGNAAIIANPNCSTIQMVVALAPLHQEWGLRSVRVATYQSVSGAGTRAIEELRRESTRALEGTPPGAEVFPRPIAFNALPHIGPFVEDGETQEEAKMRNETRRIMDLPELPVSATCVRVPVERGHSEAVWATFERTPDSNRAREILARAGVSVIDDVEVPSYPHALEAAGSPDVFVGRIRADGADPQGLAMWVVSDNLLKGAATNALQIAEHLVARGRIPRAPGTP